MNSLFRWRRLPLAILLFSLCFSALTVAGLPLSVRESQETPTLFAQVSPEMSGVDLRLDFPSSAHFDLMTDQTSGSGVAIGDVDGDGLPDLFFTAYNQGNRLYRNLGDWRFEDVTQTAGVSGDGRWCGGASFVDIDNDNDLDLYVCVYGDSNLLFVNRGDGAFDERAEAFGLDYKGASVMMSFADYDRDGDLDGYLVTHRLKDRRYHLLPKSTLEAVDRGILLIDSKAKTANIHPDFAEYFQLMDKGSGRVELVIAGQEDRLFRNEGNGKFRLANHTAGISGFGIGLAASWWDFNDDGWPDLYVSNDYKGADQLYRNNQDGTFTETSRKSLPHVPWFSMGSDSADINNDGKIDFLASDMSGRDHFSQKMGMGDMGKNRWFLIRSNPQQYMRNALYLGTGTERVLEAANLAGIANTDWTWSPKFGDLDMDGRVDLFVSNGMSRDFMNSDLAASIRSREDSKWRDTAILKQSNLAYRNLGDLAFEPVAAPWGLDQKAASYGVAMADLDRDGDLDLVVSSFDEVVSIYRNQSHTGAALEIRLVGRESNRWGLGCKVVAEQGGLVQTRVLTSGQGFMSANEPLIHFGFPDDSTIKRLSVEWSSGVVQELTEIKCGQLLEIKESLPRRQPVRENDKPRPWFATKGSPISWRHQERYFDDYREQPLLPARQSQSGPGIAVGDVNGDDVEDFFLGGAAGQSGTLFIRASAGQWKRLTDPFALDTNSEDMGVLLFDSDGDDDLDLYVVSGGVEGRAGDRLYQDRLYLNDGSGVFRKASSGVLPKALYSGSVVAACDFDADGDLDLFVGGRSVPGQYPLAEPNQLLVNERGHFSDQTESLASGLRNSGLVTGAIWSDVDGDGRSDLMVTHQWGVIQFYRNKSGMLINSTENSGLAAASGWWNGISGGDLDGDGDIDFVVSNLGRNTKYHGNQEHPSVIYYGDVDGSGVSRIVEAKFEGDVCYPERGKSCSTSAIPSLAGKFASFERFALASLADIYPSQNLSRAIRLEVNTMDSVILRNETGRFQIESLPRVTQIAPAFGVAMTDFDANGLMDVLMVQNDFSPQPETGRMDGGVGFLLAGRPSGRIDPLWPRDSGVILPGDSKAAVVVDLNRDSRPDVLVTQNNGSLRTLLNQYSTADRDRIAVRLRGPRGNPTGIGARVSVGSRNAGSVVQEVYSGNGYLGQSTSTLFFGLGNLSYPLTVAALWPDGTKTSTKLLKKEEGIIVIEYSEKP